LPEQLTIMKDSGFPDRPEQDPAMPRQLPG
jgi:hypothetical protein